MCFLNDYYIMLRVVGVWDSNFSHRTQTPAEPENLSQCRGENGGTAAAADGGLIEQVRTRVQG